MIRISNNKPKPFLKWAGGKTQLLDTIHASFPIEIANNKFTYIEPFVGSGAVLFSIINSFPNLEKAVINDVSSDLINCYKVIRKNVNELINILESLEKEYHQFKSKPGERKMYYYSKRELFNSRKSDLNMQAALFIFLNRTCFNGLYRVNRNNSFNVPIGSYLTPMICDEQNLLTVSKALENVEILNLDFSETENYISENTFFYFDPPYKPLSNTSSFNSYAKDVFDDSQQKKLYEFCKKLDESQCLWMLSNSDVKSHSADEFFDKLFEDYHIKRVKAKRSINANPSKRGELNELIITNYQNEQVISFA